VSNQNHASDFIPGSGGRTAGSIALLAMSWTAVLLAIMTLPAISASASDFRIVAIEDAPIDDTGDLINPARLRLRPWTRYSLEYKEQLEREKGNRPGR